MHCSPRVGQIATATVKKASVAKHRATMTAYGLLLIHQMFLTLSPSWTARTRGQNSWMVEVIAKSKGHKMCGFVGLYAYAG